MVEFWPFAIVGAIAVAAAVLMLLSENAVHSALFLIVVMACIAFLFLMLNAPFLAMVQLAVYAGAIMVLFLFVIMLLGAERVASADPGEGKQRFRWFTPAAVVVTVLLLFSVGTPLLLGEGGIPTPPAQPQVRVINAASDVEAVSVLADGEVIADVPQGEASPFVTLPAGEHTISLASGGEATTVTLEPGSVQSIVVAGAGNQPTLSLLAQDMSEVPDRTSRVVLYNADPEANPISLVDFGSPLVEDDTRVLIADLAAGEASEPIIASEGTTDWAVVDAADNENVLYDLPEYQVERGNSDLLILTRQRIFDGSLRPFVLPVVTLANPTFGSPRAIGYELFTTYLLPFQMVAVLLLAAMVGVIVLTHRETDKSRRRMGRRRVSRPLANVIAAQVGTESVEPPAQLPDAETVGK
ncbi:MAG TPA: NADH-quinone oxidoreductase subunit J [Oceanobacillus sp.]|nr:NADH-quinone oxidoreductase subunit J [Oceanobacillus sp.]